MNRSEEINFCHVWKINYFFLFFFSEKNTARRNFYFCYNYIFYFRHNYLFRTIHEWNEIFKRQVELLWAFFALSLFMFRSSLFLAFVFSLWHVLFSATTVSTPFSDKKSPVLSDSVVEIRNNFRAGFSTQHTLISILHPCDPVKASLFDPLTLALLLPCEVWISLSLPLFFFVDFFCLYFFFSRQLFVSSYFFFHPRQALQPYVVYAAWSRESFVFVGVLFFALQNSLMV